jgi:glycerol-3-phosphate dehydrogenase (NAD(P)+)
MPGYRLHENLIATTNLELAVNASQIIFLSIPSSAFSGIVERIAPMVTKDHMLVSTTKGIVAEGFQLMSQIILSKTTTKRVGVISGPNLAKEVAKRVLTATVIASEDEELRQDVQKILANDYFRVYANNDVFGVELAGTLKNIYAICSGLGAALGMGDNTRSMLITRSLAEMIRFTKTMGANPLTLIGLAGIGDLIVTCTSPLSRNYRVGYAIGKGKTLQQAVTELGEVAEGVNTIRLVKDKAEELDVYMPLVNCMYDILFNNLSVEQAIKTLMQAAQSSDVEIVLPSESL